VLINAFFQVKLKLPLRELIIALTVIIDFTNHFRCNTFSLSHAVGDILSLSTIADCFHSAKKLNLI